MIKKLFYTVLLLICCAGFQGCPIDFPGMREDYDMFFYIINKSNESIGYFWDVSDSVVTTGRFQFKPKWLLGVDKKKKNGGYRSELEQGKRVNFIVFKETTLRQYSWEEMVENNIYDKLYILSLEELEAVDYTIVYDGK